jgi:hypothetical protein
MELAKQSPHQRIHLAVCLKLFGDCFQQCEKRARLFRAHIRFCSNQAMAASTAFHRIGLIPAETIALIRSRSSISGSVTESKGAGL